MARILPMEDNNWWKTAFDGGQRSLMRDALRLKMRFDGRQPWWKKTFDRRQLQWLTPLMMTTFKGQQPFVKEGRLPSVEVNLWSNNNNKNLYCNLKATKRRKPSFWNKVFLKSSLTLDTKSCFWVFLTLKKTSPSNKFVLVRNCAMEASIRCFAVGGQVTMVIRKSRPATNRATREVTP